jgi:hypothetical protein
MVSLFERINWLKPLYGRYSNQYFFLPYPEKFSFFVLKFSVPFIIHPWFPGSFLRGGP